MPTKKEEVTRENTLERFLATINYNREKMNVTVDGLTVNLDYDLVEDEKSSYLDEDYFTLTKEWLIHINGFNRGLRPLVYDFYHEIGHILLKIGGISVSNASAWLDRKEYKPSDRKYILAEMACDEYAIKMLDYEGQLTKYLPLVNINKMGELHPDSSKEEIKSFVVEVNNDTKIRRNYLDWLVSEHAILCKPEKKVKPSKPITSLDDFKLPPDDRPRKFMPGRFRLIKELAESCGIDTRSESEKIHPVTTMMQNLSDMHLTSNWFDDFNTQCERIIRAITSPMTRSSDWYVTDNHFEEVTEEPADWDTTYKNYFYFDKPKNAYVHYTKLKVVDPESVKEEKEDETPTDTTGLPEVSDDEKTETKKNKKEKKEPVKYIYTIPKFPKCNVWKEVKNDKKGIIEATRIRYAKMVKEFLVPYYHKYNSEVHCHKRNELKYIIENILQGCISSNRSGYGEIEIEYHRKRFLETDKVEESVKTGAVGMMSYNDRIKAAKEKHKQLKVETDDEYNARIKRIIDKEMAADRDAKKRNPYYNKGLI